MKGFPAAAHETLQNAQLRGVSTMSRPWRDLNHCNSGVSTVIKEIGLSRPEAASQVSLSNGSSAGELTGPDRRTA